jgi:predicted membrane protein
MDKKIIKIIIALLLFLCLLDMPYGYYQFVRFVAMISFGYLAFSANEESKKNEVFIYLALAILFQPLIKFSFGRTLWNVIDVIVGVGLLLSVFNKKK